MLTTNLPLEISRWMSFSFSIFLTALMRSSASSSFSTFHILLEMRMWSSFTPSFEAIAARIGPMCAMSCRLAVVPPLSGSGRTPRASVLIFASVFMLFMSVFSISLLPDIGWLGGVLAVSTVLVACAWSRSDKDVRGCPTSCPALPTRAALWNRRRILFLGGRHKTQPQKTKSPGNHTHTHTQTQTD